MALPTFKDPIEAQAAGYDAIPLTFGGIVYVSAAGKEALANGASGAAYTLPAATTAAIGGVKKTPTIAALAAGADAATIVTTVNDLIAKLKAAGIVT